MRPRTLLLLLLPVAAIVGLLLVLLAEDEAVERGDPAPADRAESPAERLPPAPEPAEPAAPADPTVRNEPDEPPWPPPPGSVSGRIVIPDGDASDIPVVVGRYAAPGDPPDLDVWFETVTGPDGSFGVDGLRPGRHGLVARPPGLPPRRVKFEVPPEGGDVPVEIAYEGTGSLVVVLPEREGIAHRNVMVSISRKGGGGARFGHTDTKGELLFERLRPGTWSVDVKANFGWTNVEQFESIELAIVEEGETTRHVVGGSAWIRGMVYGPKGKPLPDAIVRMTPVGWQEKGYRMLQTRTDKEGRYLFRRIPAVEYDLDIQVTGDDSWCTAVGRVTVGFRESKIHEIRVPDTSLSGRITRADTGEPLHSRQVQINAYAGTTLGVGQSYMAWSKEDGSYSFVGLPPGRYSIWVSPLRPSLRLEAMTRVVELPAEGHLEGVDFALAPKKP